MHWSEVPSIPLPRPWLEFFLLATVDNSNNPSHHWMSLLTFPDRGPMGRLERNCQLQPNAEQVSSSFAQVSCLKSPTLTLFIRPQKSWHVQIIFGRPNVSQVIVAESVLALSTSANKKSHHFRFSVEPCYSYCVISMILSSKLFRSCPLLYELEHKLKAHKRPTSDSKTSMSDSEIPAPTDADVRFLCGEILKIIWNRDKNSMKRKVSISPIHSNTHYSMKSNGHYIFHLEIEPWMSVRNCAVSSLRSAHRSHAARAECGLREFQHALTALAKHFLHGLYFFALHDDGGMVYLHPTAWKTRPKSVTINSISSSLATAFWIFCSSTLSRTMSVLTIPKFTLCSMSSAMCSPMWLSSSSRSILSWSSSSIPFSLTSISSLNSLMMTCSSPSSCSSLFFQMHFTHL